MASPAARRGRLRRQKRQYQVTGALPVYGVHAQRATLLRRFFHEAENQTQDRVALLGQTVVNICLEKQNPGGSDYQINHIRIHVIGVLPIKGPPAGGTRTI